MAAAWTLGTATVAGQHGDNPGGTFADWNTRVACSGDEGR